MRKSGTIRDLGSGNVCQTCGLAKQSFPTRSAAKQVAKKIPKPLRVYQCGAYWHLTSAPAGRVAAIRRLPMTDELTERDFPRLEAAAR